MLSCSSFFWYKLAAWTKLCSLIGRCGLIVVGARNLHELALMQETCVSFWYKLLEHVSPYNGGPCYQLMMVNMLTGHVRVTLQRWWWNGSWLPLAAMRIFSGDVSAGAGMRLCSRSLLAVDSLISMMLFLVQPYAAYHQLVMLCCVMYDVVMLCFPALTVDNRHECGDEAYALLNRQESLANAKVARDSLARI